LCAFFARKKRKSLCNFAFFFDGGLGLALLRSDHLDLINGFLSWLALLVGLLVSTDRCLGLFLLRLGLALLDDRAVLLIDALAAIR